jgi:[ribosomal protein S5]-alanine N-acetyltransferase
MVESFDLPTVRTRLERPAPCHEREYLDACRRSRAFHRGLVTTAATRADYRAKLENAARPHQQSFFVVIAASGQLAGAVDLLDIEGEPARVARLGYLAFVPHAAAGFMREGVSRVIDVAFRDLGLTRLHADIQAGNERSSAFAQRLGFVRSGLVVNLKVGSRWVPHERWVLPEPGAHSRALPAPRA